MFRNRNGVAVWVIIAVVAAVLGYLLAQPRAGSRYSQAAMMQGYGATRSVHGMVTDAQGEPIKGAVVQIENTKTMQVRSYVTQNDGKYVFHGLSTDIDYELSAAREGRKSNKATLSQFNSASDAEINLKLGS